jgi:hypothetical protein
MRRQSIGDDAYCAVAMRLQAVSLRGPWGLNNRRMAHDKRHKGFPGFFQNFITI